ncbi:Hsp20 family protein [Collinsella sp. An2]|uniref:Hsp20/alpha crystallin family protein n=1 Tax=Collinsella sp. An2 TaxID=1965585 RepID=UPI000B38A846|nr:Hsp20 family protein [Collinsella sp. An2]OUP10431.1 heat-shock protein Hsp20 [Collinsella sp. An2]
MASMIPYRSMFGIRPTTSLFDALDDMMDFANAPLAKAFPIDVEDTGTGYEVKAYLTGVSKDDIDVELNEGRLSISVNVQDKEEDKDKNYLQKEFTSYSATRGVYLKDAASEGLSAKYADGVLTVTVPKIQEKSNVTKISID